MTGAFDTHSHIQDPKLIADFAGVLDRAAAEGLAGIALCGYDAPSNTQALELAARSPLLFPTVGFHPHEADEVTSAMLAELETLVSQPEVVAVGEIGLDFLVEPREGSGRESQWWWYAEQLRIASDFDLPVLLHARRAVDAVLKGLREIRVGGGIAHAFNGSRQQAGEFIKLGFKLGFGGAMTHPRATRLRDLAATLPLDSIVLETDAPDIPPAWLGKARNEPAELSRIAAVLAELRNMRVEDIVAATTANALGVLPRLTFARR